jgi:nicotinic acid mononucleotide adenylyltransferase
MSRQTGRIARRAVYPGSFDPPTIAHLAIAVATLEQCRCDSLTFVLSRSALGKEDRSDTVEARALLLRALVDDQRFVVEVTSTRFIAEIAQGYDVVVVGADKWAQVLDATWYSDETARDDAVASLPHVALVPRPPHTPLVVSQDAMTVLELADPILAEVSSTAVRSGRTDWAARPLR